MRAPTATAFGSLAYAWQQLWKYFLHLFLIGIVVAVANSVIQTWYGGEHAGESAGFVFLNLFSAAFALLVAPVFNFGGNWLYLRLMRDEPANVVEIFDGFKKGYLTIVLANLLTLAIVGIGLLVLIVPGLIFACRLAFVPYLVMDKGMDPAMAIEESWAMTRGHGWRIFGMYLLAILMFFCGLVLLLVGALFAWMWMSSAFASLYHAVDLERQAQLNQNGAPA